MVSMFHLQTGQDWLTLRKKPPLRVLVSLVALTHASFDLRRQCLMSFSQLSEAVDPWSSESSGSFVTLQMIPGKSSFDWGEPLEPGPDSEEFLQPPVDPTPAEKKVCFKGF